MGIAFGRRGLGVTEAARAAGVVNEMLLCDRVNGCSDRGFRAARKWTSTLTSNLRTNHRRAEVAAYFMAKLYGHGAASLEPGYVEAEESLRLLSLPVVPSRISEREETTKKDDALRNKKEAQNKQQPHIRRRRGPPPPPPGRAVDPPGVVLSRGHASDAWSLVFRRRTAICAARVAGVRGR